MVLFLTLCLALFSANAVAQTNLLVSHFNGNVYSLTLSGAQLSVKQALKAGGTWPAWLLYDNDTRTVFVNDEANWVAPTLTSLSVAADGTLRQTAAAKSGGELHSAFFGGRNGKGFIAVVQYENSGLWTYKLPMTSSSQPLQKLGPWTMPAPGPVPSRQNKPHPHSALLDPTGRFLLVGDLGADLIRVFAVNQDSGQLTSCADIKTAPGDGPRHAAFWTAADGTTTSLYVVNELANTVTAYRTTYPAAAGGCLGLAATQTLSTFRPNGPTRPGTKASAIQVVDRHLYVANRNDETYGPEQDSLAFFTLGATDGRMEFVETANAHAFFPRTFRVNKAGTLVVVGGQTSSNVAVIRRDANTGRLGELVASTVVGSVGMPNEEDGLSAVVWVE